MARKNHHNRKNSLRKPPLNKKNSPKKRKCKKSLKKTKMPLKPRHFTLNLLFS